MPWVIAYRHRIHFKSATIGIRLVLELIMQPVCASEGLAKFFYLVNQVCTTSRMKRNLEKLVALGLHTIHHNFMLS